ncbi:hypothetical protein GGI16_004074 [Coemansia sp. S142-1]|nr:hypothetical protein GGI16_004074 [Coemansia sp. S142-1]
MFSKKIIDSHGQGGKHTRYRTLEHIPITFDIEGSAGKSISDGRAPAGKAPAGKAPAGKAPTSATNVAAPANPANPATTLASAAAAGASTSKPSVAGASTSAGAAAAGASTSASAAAAGASTSKPGVAGASTSKPGVAGALTSGNVAAAGASASKPSVPVKTDIRVIEIKQAIEEKEGIPPAQQRLIFGGVQMADDNFAIADYKIESGSVLHLVLALRGGDNNCAI